jgi:hypothetical protein
MDIILRNAFFFDEKTGVLTDELTTDFVRACKACGVWETYGIVCLPNRLLRVIYFDVAEFDEYTLNVWLKKFPENTWGLDDEHQAIAVVFAEYPIPY